VASTGSKNSAAWGSRPAELNWDPRPPAIRVRGVCLHPRFTQVQLKSKLHSGTLLGLRERPGGAQTQRLSKLAALSGQRRSSHWIPRSAEVCKLLSDAYLSCGQRGEASGCDAGHDAPGTNVGSVAARSSAHMEHSEKHRWSGIM